MTLNIVWRNPTPPATSKSIVQLTSLDPDKARYVVITSTFTINLDVHLGGASGYSSLLPVLMRRSGGQLFYWY
jgi:hypothetical protein